MQRRVRRADGRLCSWNTRSLDFLRPLMSVILTSSAWFIQLSTVNYEPREGGLNSHRRSMMSLLMYLHFSIYISGLDKHHVTDLNKVWTYQRLKCDVYIFYFYIYYVKCEPHYNIKSNLWFLYYCISPQLVCWLSLCNVLFPSSLIHSNIIREKRYRFNVLLHLFHNRTGHKFPWWQLAVDF